MNWSVIKRNETGIPGSKLCGGGDIGGSVVVGSVGASGTSTISQQIVHIHTHTFNTTDIHQAEISIVLATNVVPPVKTLAE